MTDPESAAQEVLRSLRRVHRGTLALLAVCAVIVFASANPNSDLGLGGTDIRFTASALGLGIASIVMRGLAASSKRGFRARLAFAITSILLAGAIGLVGVALSVLHDEREAALLYATGGFILALRGPPAPAPSSPRKDPS